MISLYLRFKIWIFIKDIYYNKVAFCHFTWCHLITSIFKIGHVSFLLREFKALLTLSIWALIAFKALLTLSIWALIALSYLCVYGPLQNVTHLVHFRFGFSLFLDTKQSPLFLLNLFFVSRRPCLLEFSILAFGWATHGHLLDKAQPQIFKPSFFFTSVLKSIRPHRA